MSTSNTVVHLGPEEVVGERPFTNPDKNADDLVILRHMRNRLCRLLRESGKLPSEPRPLVLQFLEDDIRRHRIVISRLEDLLSHRELIWVGFCGRKQPGADWTQLDDIDVELIDEFCEHPDLLSYSSLQLGNGDWRNLVLFKHVAGIQHWRTSKRHAYAAQVLSPRCYTCIRLHNGRLSGGLMSGNDLIIHSTKYYDFRSEQLWHAVREFKALTPND